MLALCSKCVFKTLNVEYGEHLNVFCSTVYIITQLSWIHAYNWTIVVFCCGVLLKVFLNSLLHCCPWQQTSYTARFILVLSFLSHNKLISAQINIHLCIYLVSCVKIRIQSTLPWWRFILWLKNTWLYIISLYIDIHKKWYIYINIMNKNQAINKTVHIAFTLTPWVRNSFCIFYRLGKVSAFWHHGALQRALIDATVINAVFLW